MNISRVILVCCLCGFSLPLSYCQRPATLLRTLPSLQKQIRPTTRKTGRSPLSSMKRLTQAHPEISAPLVFVSAHRLQELGQLDRALAVYQKALAAGAPPAYAGCIRLPQSSPRKKN